jgi:hypothetical protein
MPTMMNYQWAEGVIYDQLYIGYRWIYQRYILALPEFGEKRYRYIIFVWKGDLNVESNQYLF